MAETVEIHLHPSLKEHLEFYQGVSDFDDGTKKRVSHYLIPYEAEAVETPEGDKAFKSRKNRLYNKNWVKPFVNLHLAHTSQELTLNLGESKNEVWTQIKDDCTRFGMSFKLFFRELLRDFIRDGMVGVLVDGPSTTSESKADAQANKERSYQIKYRANQILYWSSFTSGPEMGQLKDLVLDDGVVSIDGKVFKKLRRFVRDGSLVTVQILHSVEEANAMNSKWEGGQSFNVMSTIPFGLGIIPFHFFGSGPEYSLVGLLWELNHAIMNRCSVESNITYHQGFQRVAFFGVKPDEVKKIGEWLGILINNENAKIEAIPAGDPVAVRTERESLEWFLTRIGKLEFNQLSDATKQVQSADSKRLDTEGRKKLYDFVLDIFEYGIARVFSFHAEFEKDSSVTPSTITVRIERDYGLEDEQKEALEREQAFSMAERLGARLIQKKLLKVAISKIVFVAEENATPEDVKQDLMKYIDGLPDEVQAGSSLTTVFDRIQNRLNPQPPGNVQ